MKEKFYKSTIAKLLLASKIDKNMRTLVICGDEFDKNVFLELGFSDVTISNLDQRVDPKFYHPYAWSLEDAENLSFRDNEFDLVVVHAGLHHCRSPHKALLEMYRVSKCVVLAFETRDNLLACVGTLFGFVAVHEVEAVVANDYKFGGVRNSEIPNFIYRFYEREINKTIQSYAPEFIHDMQFFYGLNFPFERLQLNKNKILVSCAYLSYPFIKILTTFFPKQGNLFAFAIFKPNIAKKRLPWIEQKGDSLSLNKEWCQSRYESKHCA